MLFLESDDLVTIRVSKDVQPYLVSLQKKNLSVGCDS